MGCEKHLPHKPATQTCASQLTDRSSCAKISTSVCQGRPATSWQYRQYRPAHQTRGTTSYIGRRSRREHGRLAAGESANCRPGRCSRCMQNCLPTRY
eukprot:365031-Chlamydomonas_euryale.AAC.10